MRRIQLLLFIVFVNLSYMNSQTATYNLKSKSSGVKFVNSYDNRNVKTTKAYKKKSLAGKSVVLHNSKSAKTVIFSETFDDGSLPEDWSNIDNASGGTWAFDNPGDRIINTTTGSTGFAIFDSKYLDNDEQSENSDLISPTIDCSALTAVFLSFEQYFYAGDGGYGEVFISNDNGSTWTSLESWNSSSTDNAALATYDITALAAGKSQVKIKWNWQGNFSWYWAIDDIMIFVPNTHDLEVNAISPLVTERDNKVTPVVTILNKGISTESTYSVTLSDGDSYNYTINVTTPLNAITTYDVVFPDFTASELQYNLTATVVLSADEVSANNELSTILQTYNIRAALASQWNSGSSINGLYWLPTDRFKVTGTSTQMQGLAWKDSILYCITEGGAFGRINFSDASFTVIGETEISADFFTSLSYDPITEKIYASTLSGDYPDFTVSLYEINTSTGIGKYVASSSTKGNVAYFAFDNAGQLYAIRHIPEGNGILYAVNKNTAEMTEIGDLGGIVSANFQPMAYDVHENRMYFQASSYSDEMKGTYLIDLKTAYAQRIGIVYPYQISSMEIPDFDASLMDLKIDGVTVENFSPGKFVYQVTLPSGTTSIPTVTAKAFYPKATVVFTDATTLPGNANVLVTATDGTKHTYTVHFSVSANTNAGLSDLLVNGSTIEGFSEEVTSYDIQLPSGTSTVPAVTATTIDANASTSISDAASLPGSTTVTVTAADGTTQQVYTINFTVEPITDATLSDLRYNGISIEDFSPSINTYYVELPYGTTDIPYVRATTTDLNASASISDASSLPGSATVTVTAADGITQMFYTINFTVALPSTDATLSDLTVDGTTVTGFSGSDYEYDVVLPYGTTVIPQIGAIVADNTATPVITNAASLPGSGTVVVTAQDGTTQLTYTVHFTITPASTNASLSDLTVNGTTVTGFSGSDYEYDIVLPYGTTVVPQIGATVADNTATRVITNTASLPGSATVVVTAQDGTTQLTYAVHFTITPASTNASLSDLTVNGTTVTGFSGSDYEYDIVLPYGTTVVPQIGATVADNTATPVITNAASLLGSGTVVVTAQDGTTQLTYTVHFTVSTVSTVNELQENSLKIFPVPVNDIMHIESETIIYEITLIDLNGQKVLAHDYNNKEVTLNLSGLSTGMYFVSVQTSDGVFYKKIQINR